MENRVNLFYELHNNKWFHILNLSLDIIKSSDQDHKKMLMRFGPCFYYNMPTGIIYKSVV